MIELEVVKWLNAIGNSSTPKFIAFAGDASPSARTDAGATADDVWVSVEVQNTEDMALTSDASEALLQSYCVLSMQGKSAEDVVATSRAIMAARSDRTARDGVSLTIALEDYSSLGFGTSDRYEADMDVTVTINTVFS